jgi:CubicO group peptidase (beta-lactamase class C family)
MRATEEKPTTASTGAAGKNRLTKEFRAFVEEVLEKWKVPGMSLAVIDGEDVYAEVHTIPQLSRT